MSGLADETILANSLSNTEVFLIDVGKLTELVCGDRELLEELIRLFASDQTVLTEEIEAGLKSEDFKKVQYASHRLKGQLRNFFAEDLAKLAGRIEEVGEAVSLEEAQEDYKNLLDQIPKLLQELENLLSSPTFTK